MQQLVFLTGGTGLIGGNLLVHLHKAGFKVRALIRRTSSFSQLKLICDFYGIEFQPLYDSVEWVYGDTLDFIGLRDTLKGADTVYHCAAIVSFSKKNRKELLRTNIQGTANMVDASIECGVSHFCFISSIGALGDAKKGEFIDETSARDINSQRSFYSESKYLSE
ncbi:MAG: NAD-dependent epimerase/dehydratase family protein, partial [Bacteroidota bacterium]|nr:NAD-dependent epimerase/dehydratase family protein [Bacteroidota bacterium]